jgi:hypothetical protein
MNDKSMGGLADRLVLTMIAVGVICGIAYVAAGIGNALARVNWVEVGVVFGIAVLVIAIGFHFEHQAAQEKAQIERREWERRRQERERERREWEAIRHQKLMDRPVIPSSAAPETIDGHSKLNRILRVDDETIAKVWDD